MFGTQVTSYFCIKANTFELYPGMATMGIVDSSREKRFYCTDFCVSGHIPDPTKSSTCFVLPLSHGAFFAGNFETTQGTTRSGKGLIVSN